MLLNELSSKVLDLISKGTSVTLIHLPSSGRRNFLKLINTQLSNQDKYIHIELEAKEIIQVTVLDFYKSLLFQLKALLVKSSYEDSSLKPLSDTASEYIASNDHFGIFMSCREITQQLVQKYPDKKIIFSITGISKFFPLGHAFFESIKSIRDIKERGVAFVFIDTPELLKGIQSGQTGELTQVLTNHVFNIPIPDESLFQEILDFNADLFSTDVSGHREKIWTLTNGYAGFVKYLVLFLSENPAVEVLEIATVIGYKPLAIRIQRLVDCLPEVEAKTIRDIAHGLPENLIDKAALANLKSYGLVNDELQITIPVLSSYIQQHSNKTVNRHADVEQPKQVDSRLVIKSGSIFIDGLLMKTALSKREFDVLEYFISHPNVVISRDEISGVIWKEDSTEKYSDWAIDQVISRLRSKLDDSGYVPKYIKTIKGRGFRYELE